MTARPKSTLTTLSTSPEATAEVRHDFVNGEVYAMASVRAVTGHCVAHSSLEGADSVPPSVHVTWKQYVPLV